MALDKSTLEIRLRIAFAKSGTNPSPSSQTELAQDLADAIFQYLIGADIDYKEDVEGAHFIIRNPNAKTMYPCHHHPTTTIGIDQGHDCARGTRSW